jgi:hypothetical protein
VRAAWLSLLLVAASAGAQPALDPQTADPLRSKACRAALAALDDRETALRTTPPAPAMTPPTLPPRTEDPRARADLDRARADLDRAQAAAALACLGETKPSAAPPRTGTPPPSAPLTVPPAAAVPSRAGVAIEGTPTRPSPAVREAPRRPLVTTSCDPAGCWADDGSRLQRFGSQLVGPRGVCSVTGSVLNCP